ncbi:MAG: NAD-dependent epimerase/dehydratase [Streptosporangiaceae bacterium]|nr:NAD-dependent epimerase/dehydratase [Streptosporangiaceae bacterium]
MRVAVTGASGFVGGAVSRALIGRGAEVHAFGRRSEVEPGHVAGARYRPWDIATGVLRDPPRVDAVVHCAGTVADWGPAADFFTTNLCGTYNVLASFPAARFVHVSTASVYDPCRPTVMATEDEAPAGRYPNAYGASKAAAERAVLAAADRPVVVLRPHAVYGPGDTTLLPRLLAGVRGRILPAVGDGRQRISLTSVGNLVQACVRALGTSVPAGVYNVADAEPVRLDDALRAILAERGVHARPVYAPASLAWPLAWAAEGAFLLARRARPPRLTRYAAGHLAVERTLDTTAARTELGFTPARTSFTGAGTW